MMTSGCLDLAKRSELKEVVQEFLSLPEETGLVIARDM